MLAVVAYLLTLVACTYSHMMIIYPISASQSPISRESSSESKLVASTSEALMKARKTRESTRRRWGFPGNLLLDTRRTMHVGALLSLSVDWSLIWAAKPPIHVHFLFDFHSLLAPLVPLLIANGISPFSLLHNTLSTSSSSALVVWKLNIFFTFSAYYCFTASGHIPSCSRARCHFGDDNSIH